MYRQNSFSSVTKSPSGEVDGTQNDNDQIIFLKSSGRFYNKNALAMEGGVVAVFRNHAVRNKIWPISTVCFNAKSGGFAIADERGQVYKMSVQNNLYNSIRFASTGVSAMAFISQHKNHLVVAYDSGSIVVLDTHTKDIIGNLQVKNKAIARIIQSHPSELKVAIASDDKTLAIWDLNSCKCIQSMQCEEPIVDVRYELGGRIIVVVLEHTGAYLYSTDASAEMRMHLKLPSSETAPKWTAYCAYNVYLDNNPFQSAGRQRTPVDPVALNVLLASHTSMLYSWHVTVADLLQPGRDRSNALRVGGEVVPPSHLVGVVELPLKNRVAVALQLLNPNSTNSGSLGAPTMPTNPGASFSAAAADLPPRLLVLTQTGGMLIVDIEGFQVKSAGFYTVKADLEPRLLHGAEASLDVGWQAQSVGSRKNTPATTTSGAVGASNNSAYGKVHGAKNLFVVVGCDGMARLFDLRATLGTGTLCGSVLRSRVAKASKTGTDPSPRSAVHHAPSHAHHYSQPTAASVRAGAHSAHLVTEHGMERRASSTNQAADAVSPSQASSTAHPHRTQSIDSVAAGYDFILQDSQDDGDNASRSARRTTFRSASTGRAGAAAAPAGTFGTSPRAASSARTRSVSGMSETTRRSGSQLGRDRSAGKMLQSFVATHKGRKTDKEVDTSHLPLFELAALTPKESQVNARKLRNFLELHGEFPARYRPLIWRFLLKLPENTVAFADLVNRGVHANYEDLYDKYPIQNRKVFDRLQNLCSQMAHWAPILADAPYLPALVFPFTLVYNTDELAALETCITVMMWWGHSWHATHPSPPVHIMDALDTLLKYHDSKLYTHLKALKANPGVLGWAMLSNLFTEILSRTNWLKLMDCLISHFEEISIILLAPIALMKELKSVLLTCDTPAQVTLLLRSQQSVNMITVTRTMLEWLRHTPPKYFSAVATRHLDGVRLELGPGKVTEELRLGEVDQAGENLALSSGRPMFPITKGRYPVYDGFPQHVLDLQIRERNQILALGKEIARRESVLGALQQKLTEVETEHAAWMNRHKSASDAELRHQTETMMRERAHLAELQRIEEEISRQRLATLTSLENAAKDEMELMDRAAREAKRLLEEGEEHMKEKISIQLSLQKHREVAEQAEVATHERIRQLQMSRIRDNWVKNVNESIKGREEELSVRDAILNEQWRKEDDRQRLLREQRTKELKVLEEEARMAALQEDLAIRMQRLQMERDAKVVEIERMRALRLAKEQAEEALEAAERSTLALRKTELLSSTEQSALVSEQVVKKAGEKLMESLSQVEREAQKILEADKVHLLRQNKARMQARQAQLRQEMIEKSSKQLTDVIAAQGELQAQMLRLQQAALRSEIEKDAAHATATATTSAEMADARRQVETLQEAVLQEQRQRFEEIQEYMRSQQQQQHQPPPAAPRQGGAVASPGTPGDDYPDWDRPPSAIPAPLSGAGIGYGIRPPAPPAASKQVREARVEQAAELSDIERDARAFKLPLDKAVKVAGAAMRGSLVEQEDDDSLGDAPTNVSSHIRRHDLPMTAQAMQRDALDLAAAEDAYEFAEEHTTRSAAATTSRTASTTTTRRSFTTTTSNPRGLHAMTADSLRLLADQSLRNLQATRVMNRDEVEQERQEHKAFQQTPDSTPGGTAPSSGERAPRRGPVAMTGITGMDDAPAPSYTAAPARAQSGVGSTPGSPPRRGVIVDSDTALWALDDGSEDDLY